MKRKIFKYTKEIISVFILLFAVGCGDVLDNVEDLSHYPGEGTFDDITLSTAYLTTLYAETLGRGWPIWDGEKADEQGGIIHDDWVTINNGNMKTWRYSALRKINLFLRDVPKGSLDEEIKSKFIAQARALRAIHYFDMVVYHGGVPIIKVPQEPTDDLFVTRNSTSECFDFIMEDLNAAETVLPNKYWDNDRGRIDKATVKALKGRILLYKASPQFNSSNPYDNSYWADSYTANKDAIDFCTANGYQLEDNYVDAFEKSDANQNMESILPVIYVYPGKTNGRKENVVRPATESNDSGADQPTWAHAEAYPMLDGKMPGDPTSKYTYDIQSFWENRDPRFAANIVWNGAIYELSGKQGRRQYTMSGVANSNDAFGHYIQGYSRYRTGLYCRKGIQEELLSEKTEQSDIDWPEIRLAEVMFNYAESANETGHPSEAVQVLKDIRERAGIEAGTDDMYGLKSGMSRDEIREAILAEKNVEMAFEGKRFWDLRRHRMLDRIDGTRKYGIMALKVEGNTYDQVTTEQLEKANNYLLLPSDFEYSVEELIPKDGTDKIMVMKDSYYFFPIRLEEIDKNPNLEQNIDWGGTFNPEL